MNERTDGQVRSADPSEAFDDVGVDANAAPGPGTDDPAVDAAEASVTDRLRGRLRSPFSNVFSVRLFAVYLALTFSAMVLGGAFVPLPLGGTGGLIGIAGVGFAVGLADGNRRYLEFLLAGATASGLGAVFDHLVLTVLGLGVPMVAFGVAAGGVAGVVGHYFGRDLRDGLTQDV